MIKLLVIVLMCAGSSGLMAQKGALFTYDREQVNSVMEKITESNTATGSAFAFKADSVKRGPTDTVYFPLIAFCSALVCSLGGLAIGESVGAESLLTGLLIGSALGFAVPLMVVLVTTKDRKIGFFTAAGGACGTLPGFLSYGIGIREGCFH